MSPMINLSLLADLILGTILIFLWLVRRGDRHALYWGVGQIMLGVATFAWHFDARPLWLSSVTILTGTLGLLGYVTGTLHFCGKPIAWPQQLGGWALYAVLVISVASQSPHASHSISLVALGAVLAWCGWQLSRRRHAYRLLAVILGLRAAASFAFATHMLEGREVDLLFTLGFYLKLAAALCLIHAVLQEAESSFREILNGLGHGFLIRDEEGVVRFASQKMAVLFGQGNAADFVGRQLWSVVTARTQEQTHAWFRHVTSPGRQQPCIEEFVHRRQDGVDMPVEIISVPYEERGQVRILTQIIDISERKAQEAAREHAATHDEPTGLFNRTALRNLLATRLGADAASTASTVLLLIDLDHFKRINDTLGHTIGDKVLRMVAQRLTDLEQPVDMLARFGSDEFVLVATEQDPARAQVLAERLAREILPALSQTFPVASLRISLKSSIGIAISPMHGVDPESLLSAADTALHEAKTAGRNRFCIFADHMSARSRDALLIDEALNHAIANQEFRLVYQPIVDARTRRLCKVEALIRWTTPSLGFVAPDKFIPIAEECGHIVDIGTWVLREAAQQARSWAAEPEGPIRVAVNVSPAQLVDPSFLSIVDQTLAATDAAPSEIEIEMTERVLINEADTVVRIIESLHARGLSTSLDDFGTGYSSLSYLTRFHLRTLKIDRAFVTGIEQGERNLALVRAIIAMGHSLGMRIVAEGVETETQAGILTDLGCDFLQGYLFSKPVPADQIRPRGS